ncbi:MAG: bifunctional [glutamate--ammonia ligase]-adenylyl-L-tyrosine phosphorylase/[glutamate--ammonia-ligase] adenylyltransferase [Desulfococcaceae bacterium]
MEPPVALSESLQAGADRKWEEYKAAAEAENLAPPADPGTADILKRVFVFSDFVAKSCIRDPALLDDLLGSGDLDRAYESDAYPRRLAAVLKGVEAETELSDRLRRFRRREMTRIAFRDLAGKSDLTEVTADLSALADACIDLALARLHAWQCAQYGVPTGRSGQALELVVLGMGKLGARELNFSSDIDLIFAYPESGETQDGPRTVTNNDFFLRLARRLAQVLGANTPEGFVFRVDMNLRPFGQSGPMVMSFDAMESYYLEQGREWERYAWIKARAVAGDQAGGRRLLAALNPFIYRRYLDFGVFESLREMKQKIALEVRRKGMKEDIKLGPGGIREVEFFGQIFQLIRGGVEPALQERRILKVLDILARENYITGSVRDELYAGYRFLRTVEHRLQEYADLQTHKLPQTEPERKILAESMGCANWAVFSERLRRHMGTVHDHFSKLLKAEDIEDSQHKAESSLKGVWQNPASDEDNQAILSAVGYEDPDTVLKHLADFRDDLFSQPLSREGRDRINRLMPLVLKEAARAESPATALDRIFGLIRSILGRTCYLSLLLENPNTLDHLVRLATTSAWILNFLTRHPVLLDELLDPRTLYHPPDREALEEDLRRRLEQIPEDDLEYRMDELRIFKQINVLRVAAADISNSIPLMRVSDYLSDIAETVLHQVVEISWRHLVKKHGEPACHADHMPCDRGFAVIAYGKLGGLELGYGSDLDMVFLHAGTGEQTQGERPIDTTTFFARLGQRVVHILTAHTTTGTLYEADMRLRPSGSSGLLVSSIDGFRNYQLEEAWTWEKQALIRARPIAGDRRLRERFDEIRREVLGQARDPEPLKTEIRNMRARMKKELLKPEPGMFDLKQGDGGMVDIEFLVQYLVLRYADTHPEILEWTDNVRQIRTLWDAGVIDDVTAYFLRKAYLIYRAVGHKLSLQNRPTQVDQARFADLRDRVRAAWDEFMGESIQSSE